MVITCLAHLSRAWRVVITCLADFGNVITCLARDFVDALSVNDYLHLFGDSVYIFGGQPSKMEKYDVTKNEMKTLPSLPYKVSDMATVAYKDNIVIIGGYDGKKCLNDVAMFNVTTHEYKKLPSMLKKRRFCTAVSMGDVIVVLGGCDKAHFNAVEYYVMGDSAWQKLPAMNLARFYATACVYEGRESECRISRTALHFSEMCSIILPEKLSVISL